MVKPFRRGMFSRVGLHVGEPMAPDSVSPEALRDWFAERGFVAANIEQLPQSRRELYNHNRRSKVLIKAL